ncbi:MAG: RibD family protein, partial [Verrucomicrobia bacterium]|nr:RibD family protein [Verrucomicrobiota bacterium]
MPYVALKYAMTLDGKIATKTGESKWISGEKSRQFVHQLRNRYAGILAGIGTVLKDDPMLNCRLQDENG